MRCAFEHNDLNDTKWSKRSRTYDEKCFDYFRYMQKKVILQTKIQRGANFLDLGCGK
jgi:ubiquinone/menaquinone biosynthesis C-methylase UbiE